jgi:mannose-6-phosphate isomerase-like protein (cupin superfamily)
MWNRNLLPLITAGLIFAVELPCAAAPAEPAGYQYWSAAELQSMSRTLAHKSNERTSNQDLANWGADRALVVHRTGTGSAELHAHDSDLIIVISGTATLVVGGEMKGGKNTAPGEIRGASIEGGEKHPLAAGDILHIPPQMPHQFVLAPGTKITYYTLKVKER